jgi:hypothetical protein
MPSKPLPRVYIDSCCFIDIVKQTVGTLPTERDKDVWNCKKLLEAHRAGELIVHTSVLAVAECVAAAPGQAIVPPEVQEHFRSLLTSGQYVQLLNPTPKTAINVQNLRWTHSLVLSGADGLHFASALERGCLEFITTDERLQKDKIKKAIPVMSSLGMQVIAGSGTKQLPDRFRQGALASS